MGKLHDAAKKGNLGALQTALSSGQDIESTDSKERTCLLIAASQGHTEIVKYLVDEREADVDAEDADGNTALALAAVAGHTDCVKALLAKSDEDAENSEGQTPLWLALEGNHIDTVKALLAGGADVQLAGPGGATYLHQVAASKAAAAGSEAATALLLEAGASVGALDQERCTPLMVACRAGAWAVGRQLLAAGADVKAVGRNQWTALHFCAQNLGGRPGAVDFAEVLLGAGASAKVRTRDGMTPAAVVALDAEKRSKKVTQEDDDMRDLLSEAEATEEE
ncbi:ankyrin repeat-containing domain protein [Haematococcus lacustris]